MLAACSDLEGFLGYIHADYSGWAYDDALPRDKASLRKWAAYEMETPETLLHEVRPVSIQIHGNVAIVHCYYVLVYEDAEGSEKTSRGRWTDILMKQGNMWVVIGDHGGQTTQ